MRGQEKTPAGGDQTGADNVIKFNNHFKPARNQSQVTIGEMAAEEAFIEARKRAWDEPTRANLFALGILEKTYRLMMGGPE